MKKEVKAGDINVGDIVQFRGREPMPDEMRKASEMKHVVTVAEHPYYEFESGWSVNIDMGDHIHLVTPHPDIQNRSTRRAQAVRRRLVTRKIERELTEAKMKKDAKAMAKVKHLERMERRRLRKAGLLYPKKTK